MLRSSQTFFTSHSRKQEDGFGHCWGFVSFDICTEGMTVYFHLLIILELRGLFFSS